MCESERGEGGRGANRARKEKRMGREMLKVVKTTGNTNPSSCRLLPESCCEGEWGQVSE